MAGVAEQLHGTIGSGAWDEHRRTRVLDSGRWPL